MTDRQAKTIQWTINLSMDFPSDWDDDMIEFHLNESNWCCSNLISELEKYDEKNGCISEFGEELEVCVLVKDFHGCKIYKEYDFVDTVFEPLHDDEFIEKMTIGKLLELCEQQNSIF